MNQKLSDWASIAEIVSGLAVVITLVVLIFGIRDNTQVLRASAYASSVDSLNDFAAELSRDSESLRVWRAYIVRDTQDLDEIDMQRLENYVLILFRIYEKAYFSEQYGLIGEEEWRRFDRNICSQFGRVQVAGVESTLRAVLTGEFFEYITNSCSG